MDLSEQRQHLAGTPGSRCKGQPEEHWSERVDNCASAVDGIGMNWLGMDHFLHSALDVHKLQFISVMQMTLA